MASISEALVALNIQEWTMTGEPTTEEEFKSMFRKVTGTDSYGAGIESSNGSGGGGRVSVAGAQAELTSAISDMGVQPDEAIISKLPGKAALYFAGLIQKLND